MPIQPLRDNEQKMPVPMGHAIGFVDSQDTCDAVTQALEDAGFGDASIMVLSGEDGLHLFQRAMGGSLWGETVEDVLQEGMAELKHGHIVLMIATEDRDEAVIAANVATAHGGHGFSHFGIFADERLTK